MCVCCALFLLFVISSQFHNIHRRLVKWKKLACNISENIEIAKKGYRYSYIIYKWLLPQVLSVSCGGWVVVYNTASGNGWMDGWLNAGCVYACHIRIYIYVCVCVCKCIEFSVNPSNKSLNRMLRQKPDDAIYKYRYTTRI